MTSYTAKQKYLLPCQTIENTLTFSVAFMRTQLTLYISLMTAKISNLSYYSATSYTSYLRSDDGDIILNVLSPIL